jgi:uncharacterized protein (TIGR03435 family)
MTNQLRLATLLVCLAAAQAAPDPQFEVASVKPSPNGNGAPRPYSIAGGPGTATPNRLTVRAEFLKPLILKAYDIKDYQLSAPAWLASPNYQSMEDRFDIDATMAPGTTQEQFLAMLRNLLSERFGLKVHCEQKEFSTYLLMLGKNGHKLKENLTPELSNRPSWESLPRGADGFRVMPPGYTGFGMQASQYSFHVKFTRNPLATLVDYLSGYLHTPVLDRTGLQGNYDFRVDHNFRKAPPESPEESDAPDLYTAVQSQLGLKLVPGKSTIEMLVIDHIDRVPSPN